MLDVDHSYRDTVGAPFSARALAALADHLRSGSTPSGASAYRAIFPRLQPRGMRKIPTVFRRDPEDRRYVLPEVTPGCEWVLNGEGIATRKYDGTCVMYDGERWWARREVKPGNIAPADFVTLSMNHTTGKAIGWEPIEQSPFAKFHAEAVAHLDDPQPGTYELCGPKVNGNPEGYGTHVVRSHHFADRLDYAPRTYYGLERWLSMHAYEGIVWHHPDGRMAKLKRRDFRALEQPS